MCIRDRLKAALPRNAGAGPALGLIGAVKVLYLGQRGGCVQRGPQLRSQLALLFDGGRHLGPAALQPAQIGQPLVQLAQDLSLIHI